MKIGILHLSDLHIEDDNLLHKVDLIESACNYEINQVSFLYIVLTGDISKSGKIDEFNKAKEFLISLRSKLMPRNRIMPIHYIIVPGNHDCCFEEAKSTRKEIIKSCQIDRIQDDDYFSDSIIVQKNFWNFHSEITQLKLSDRISFKEEYQLFIDFKIVFHCYNSSWISELNETCGKIVIPENKFLFNGNGELIISVFHHPLNWFSPNTKNNNKARFEEHLINTSNIVFQGHEHDKGRTKYITQKGKNVLFIEGKAFQKEVSSETGFGYHDIDIKSRLIQTTVYSWQGDKYSIEFQDNYTLTKKDVREFNLSSDFESKLDSLSIPLKHSRKNNLQLSDIFIFPDLEPIEDNEKIVQFPNSDELLWSVKNNQIYKAIIEGEDQSGKTALFYVLYNKLYSSGYLPIYLKGKNISDTDVKALVKKAIKEQYSSNDVDLFFQQKKIVVFIDNLHKSSLNIKYRPNLIRNICSVFDFVFVSVNNSLGITTTEDTILLKDFKKFKILPLGHEKRSEIIEQWFRIGENEMTLQEDILLKSIQIRLDEINSLLGDKLMPSYPIFVLTLLQGLDSQIISHDFTQTSYAHCYHALITAGLVREGLKDELSSYFNILKELAYYIFISKEESFTYKNFEKFYVEYNNTYYFESSASKVLRVLENAKIIKPDEESYSFSYKYIFFYLVAQKISVNIDQHKSLIENLCENIHIEKNANILIFLSHHSKAQILIDNIIFTSELPFENDYPITLNKDDSFTRFISEIIKDIQHDVIEEKDPKQEIKNDLKRRDDLERKSHFKSKNENELSPELIEVNQALRTIKVLGQIVKNQKGDFEKEKLENLVLSAYNTCFRYISHNASIIERNKDQIIEAVSLELNERKINRQVVEKSVLKVLQYISWRICLDSFTNLMFSVGTKGRELLYETVSQRINSSAAKIVTFAIKSYYGSINLTELKKLFAEVESNYLAQSILRVYVKRHLYTNYVEKSKKDQIIKIAGFKSSSVVPKQLK